MRKLILLFIFFPALIFAQPLSSYGPTSKSDQLWQIAILARPSAGVSVQQAMAAIFRANPTAFKNGSIYQLQSNITLQIPAQDVMQKINADQAMKVIEQQETKWQQDQAAKNSSAKQKMVKMAHKKDMRHMQVIVKGIEANAQNVSVVKKQYDDVGKVLISFDQQYQVRLADLEKHNLDLQNQLGQLQEKMSALQTQLTMQVQATKNKQTFLSPYIASLRKILGDTGFNILIAVVIILLLILLWLICSCRHRKYSCTKHATKKAKNSDDDDVDTETEYDFLGSEEGIPAKLDLARAYIDMGDKNSANEVLQEIIKQGNTEQKAEAKQLLGDLQAKD